VAMLIVYTVLYYVDTGVLSFIIYHN